MDNEALGMNDPELSLAFSLQQELVAGETTFSRLIKELESLYVPSHHNRARQIQYLLECLAVEDSKQAFDLLFKAGHEVVLALPNSSRLFSDLFDLLLAKNELQTAECLLRCSAEWRVPLAASAEIQLAKALIREGNRTQARTLLSLPGTNRPISPESLFVLYELEKLEGNEFACHNLLNRIAQAGSSPATVAHVYRERKKLSPVTGISVRIAILSSYVLDRFVQYLDLECRKAGLCPDFYIGPFNQYTQEIIQTNSGLHMFKPEIVFLSIGLEDVFPAILGSPSVQDLVEAAKQILDQLLQLADHYQRNSQAVFVISEFAMIRRSPHGILDNRLPQGLHGWVEELNKRLAEACRSRERTYVLPLRHVLSWVGIERSYDPKLHHMARMQLSDFACAELARYALRYIKPMKGLTKKCIVLDLDGTLWGGIVGELGPDGIHLGPGAPGSEYMEFQKGLLNLTYRGILLAICSKNNPDDVIPVLKHHPYMVLREEHFAAMRINWNNKADNIREIAKELNIGLDSIVYLDDNPNECELVRQLLPEVLTIDLPTDPSQYRQALESLSDFELLALTQEDQMRVAQYQAIGKRQAMRTAAASLEDYLHSLNLQVDIALAQKEHVNRLAQMCSKTNQFNLTARRYQTADIERFLSSCEYVVYALRVTDRFVDHGLVGTAIIQKHPVHWRIDTLLMSCRVMGLTIEKAFLARIAKDARQGKAQTLIGEFIPTNKNHPVKDLYPSNGFVLMSDSVEYQLWQLDLNQSTLNTPPWISL
jgi:FkbH-like protein